MYLRITSLALHSITGLYSGPVLRTLRDITGYTCVTWSRSLLYVTVLRTLRIPLKLHSLPTINLPRYTQQAIPRHPRLKPLAGANALSHPSLNWHGLGLDTLTVHLIHVHIRRIAYASLHPSLFVSLYYFYMPVSVQSVRTSFI